MYAYIDVLHIVYITLGLIHELMLLVTHNTQGSMASQFNVIINKWILISKLFSPLSGTTNLFSYCGLFVAFITLFTRKLRIEFFNLFRLKNVNFDNINGVNLQFDRLRSHLFSFKNDIQFRYLKAHPGSYFISHYCDVTRGSCFYCLMSNQLFA